MNSSLKATVVLVLAAVLINGYFSYSQRKPKFDPPPLIGGQDDVKTPLKEEQPYELLLADDKVTFSAPARISLPLIVRDLGVRKMNAPELYRGLSLVWDGKEYKLKPEHVGVWNGPGEIIPKSAWQTSVTVTWYEVPTTLLYPGKHTVAVRDRFAASNTLTIFIKLPQVRKPREGQGGG